jgi:hypothetical protein
MEFGLILIAVYSVAILTLVMRTDKPRKNRQRLTGRGGDFE